MKFLFFFLTVCLAAALGSFLNVRGIDQKPATKEFLIKQKNLLKLLNNVHMKNFFEDQVHISNTWHFMNNRDKFLREDVFDQFMRMYKSDLFLEKGKIFTIANEVHKKTAITLFHMFFYARDWTTFYNMACWARGHLNEGMFVYSLTVAVLHRKDCRGLILPPPYEIYPFYFLNSDVITKGYRLKMQGMIHDDKLARLAGVHRYGDKENVYYIKSNHTGWDVPINDETKLSYFMEDIGLNSYYFYFHADYPFWMRGDIFGLKHDRRGELFLYFYKQLLARFYMERLSNDLGEIPRFFWTKPIKTGFVSNLKFYNGIQFPSRPNFMNLKTVDNVYMLQDITDGERRIRDAVYRGFVHTKTGGVLKLDKPRDVDILGNIIQGNVDAPNKRFYKYLGMIAKGLMGVAPRTKDDVCIIPSVLDQYETALRDPMFYQIYQRFVHYKILFQNTLPFYRTEDLIYRGVKVEDITVDRLVTFFDEFDVDMSNAFYRNRDEVSRKKDDMVILARQRRLNHKEFNVNIDVTSDKGGDSIVRIFLGPKYDSMKHKIDIEHNRHNFFELDSFMYTLKVGKNTIVRNSREFLITSKDRTMTRDLIKRIDTSLTSNVDFMLDMSEAHNGFPNRLILPRGKRMGMEFVLFVMVSPFVKPKIDVDAVRYDHVISAGIGSGYRFWSDSTLGFPFDRRIVKSEFYTPNMLFKDVRIYHVTKDMDLFVKDYMKDNIMMDKTFMDKSFMDKTLIDKTFMDKGFVEKTFMDKSTDYLYKDTDFLGTKRDFMNE